MAFRSSTNATSTGTTSISVNKPAGTVDGDVLVTGLIHGSTATLTPPSGWGAALYASGAFGAGRILTVYSKVASGEPASWAWGLSTSVGVVVEVCCLSGRASATPDASNGQTNASSTSVTAPSISPSNSTDDLVGFFGVDANTTFTPPGTMTEREDASAAAANRALELATEVLAASGATGTRVATAGSAGANAGWLGAFTTIGSSVSLLVACP